MKTLDIKINEKSTGVFYIQLKGPIDTYTHEQFNERMDAILANPVRSIGLDMEGVDYVSSMGIGSIFRIRKFAREHNVKFAMVNVQSKVQKVFDTVQAMPSGGIFKSFEEMDQYLESLNS